MITTNLSKLAELIRKSAEEYTELTRLRRERRKKGETHGCSFCFGTCYGELSDGTIVPCPSCNGLCL